MTDSTENTVVYCSFRDYDLLEGYLDVTIDTGEVLKVPVVPHAYIGAGTIMLFIEGEYQGTYAFERPQLDA